MAEYRLANGEVLTDKDIDQICREFESESWAGRLRRIHQGPAAISDDPLVTVTVKIPGRWLRRSTRGRRTALTSSGGPSSPRSERRLAPT